MGLYIKHEDMIQTEELRALIKDLESDRVERTMTVSDTDKFGQAICAFANDLPNHRQPGYLVLGVTDAGDIKGVNVTDDLLKNLAAIRTDGNIQPQPSMVVVKVPMPEGDLAVVEVQPATFPPIRYKGRIWVRVGPRKGYANENDEKILYEKRNAGINTFDALPCMNATIEDLDLGLFKSFYLTKAFPEEVLELDKRTVKEQLRALGFYDSRFDCPTYAGILFFGKSVERFLSGAYVQYVKFTGRDRAGDIVTEHKFAGNLCTILPQLDIFIDTTITNKRPVPVSALREEMIYDYPHWAIRELLLNAICHRDYEGHGPIQFYEYDDRIEIMNPGYLYGKATPENFPMVNDYRNEVVAEGLKVLGFVNRFSHGVLRVNRELSSNGNGAPEYNFGLKTALLVIVHNAHCEINNVDSQGDTGLSRRSCDINSSEVCEIKGDIKVVYDLIKANVDLSQPEISKKVGFSARKVSTIIRVLKETGHIRRVGSNKTGHWEILK